MSKGIELRISPYTSYTILVSLRIQSECGKIRTRKNSTYGHSSRSVQVVLFKHEVLHKHFNKFFIFLSWIFPHMQATTRKCSLEMASLHFFSDILYWVLPCGWWIATIDKLDFITGRYWKIITFINEIFAQL